MFTDSDKKRTYDRSMPLNEVLHETRKDDCLSCRIMGASIFFGLGIYSYFSGKSQLRIQKDKILQSKSRFGIKIRQAGITSIAMTLVGMGFWRLVN